MEEGGRKRGGQEEGRQSEGEEERPWREFKHSKKK